ncbi:hypothetical protein HN51_035090 [Arachis hypogaea]|uniref:Dirigent protein n=2 Tax=Arachis hypogaea TaxID=3818 RepID=A0A445A5W0_ARAHY|nr:dirigent protein 23-like [Arachis ipaensis]XP_025643232.1 dirigent protein 23 [Arachis hypogaea]QHO00062.1 Dirigent protein [Arachis hypogaea]RYR21843.1 hypothetical protein Ahy_B03g067154 isoform A [Arachis hypogaea]
MAAIKPFSITTLLLMIFITMTMISQTSSKKSNQSNQVFYLHDVTNGPNATVAQIVGITGKVWSYNTFGTFIMVDDPITLTPNQYAVQVGRAQGTISVASMDGSTVIIVLSFVFNNVQYNGSTLELQGASRQRENSREISVVSGTGRFRFVKGYAVFETVSYDPTTTRSLIRVNVTIN